VNAASKTELYDRIHDAHAADLRNGSVHIDETLAQGNPDNRLGLSLIIPLSEIRNRYESLIRNFYALEPHQYYYPFDDLHITVFDFLQGRASYRRNSEIEADCIAVADRVSSECEPFEILFSGIVFTREAGLIRGYDGDRLIDMRTRIREAMKEIGMANDERYKSESAHCTFFRFRETLQNPEEFARSIERQRKTELGKERINHLDLVEHDWYNTKSSKRLIRRFSL
jgi:2'-5' RNA ligase